MLPMHQRTKLLGNINFIYSLLNIVTANLFVVLSTNIKIHYEHCFSILS